VFMHVGPVLTVDVEVVLCGVLQSFRDDVLRCHCKTTMPFDHGCVFMHGLLGATAWVNGRCV